MRIKRRTIQVPHFHLPKIPWKGFLAGCFLVLFFLGILTANWVGTEKMLQYGMLNQYYVGQLAYLELDAGAYFLFLLKRRIKVFGMTALFVYTRFGIFALPGVVGWYAFSQRTCMHEISGDGNRAVIRFSTSYLLRSCIFWAGQDFIWYQD